MMRVQIFADKVQFWRECSPFMREYTRVPPNLESRLVDLGFFVSLRTPNIIIYTYPPVYHCMSSGIKTRSMIKTLEKQAKNL